MTVVLFAAALAVSQISWHAAATPGTAATIKAARLCPEASAHSSCSVADTSCGL